jgi:hypothetical protein
MVRHMDDPLRDHLLPEHRWGGVQPKFEKIVMRGEDQFALVGRLASGERVDVPLGRFVAKPPPDDTP